MKNILWLLFAVIIGVFNAIAIAAALFVIDPTISEGWCYCLTIGRLCCRVFIAQMKG